MGAELPNKKQVHLMSDSKPQIQEAQKTPSKMKVINPVPRYIILKLLKIKKIKKKMPNEVRRIKDYLTLGLKMIRVTSDLPEILQTRREWNKIFNVETRNSPA
jgi:hypothetical protein